MDTLNRIQNVLIVDDDDDCLRLMSSIFEKNGAHTKIVHNGIEAKKELENGAKFDVIVTDILMPEMNGYELCQFVNHEVPMVMVSCIGREAVTSNYSELTDAYLTKSQVKKDLYKATLKAVNRWDFMVGQSKLPKVA